MLLWLNKHKSYIHTPKSNRNPSQKSGGYSVLMAMVLDWAQMGVWCTNTFGHIVQKNGLHFMHNTSYFLIYVAISVGSNAVTLVSILSFFYAR